MLNDQIYPQTSCNPTQSIQSLLQLMKTLRQKCPWDQAQTPATLTKYAIEEAYEVEAAVHSQNVQHIKEELGDLLLQVVFQAEMHQEQGAFDFFDVVNTLEEKLIRRHPHVFDHTFSAKTEEEVNRLWQEIKAIEQLTKNTSQPVPDSRLAKVKHGAALQQAQQLQVCAAQFNFDWQDVSGAWEKLDEELIELKQAISNKNPLDMMEELGDCIFALVNVGRKLDIDCEQATLATITKFRRRFAYIEQQLASQQQQPEHCTLSQLDILWNEAKTHES